MITRLSEVWTALEGVARKRGLLRLGASNLEDAHAYLFVRWLEEGREAGMTYLRRNRQARLSPREHFPWARSVVVATIPYQSERGATAMESGIARYALGDDYHLVLEEVLCDLEAQLKRLAPEATTRRYVDTGPLSDRTYAAQAGLGWIGRNGMLIDPVRGSYLFIATLLTSLENDIQAEEVADRCGSCTRCVDSCPTDAILPDRTLHSDRCISYATIEHRGAIPDLMKHRLGENVFGCDICNEVCPWNHEPASAIEPFTARADYRARPVTDLLRMSQADFSHLFRKSAVKRAKRAGMIRNAILVAPEIPEDVLNALGAEQDDGIRDALEWRRRKSATD